MHSLTRVRRRTAIVAALAAGVLGLAASAALARPVAPPGGGGGNPDNPYGCWNYADKPYKSADSRYVYARGYVYCDISVPALTINTSIAQRSGSGTYSVKSHAHKTCYNRSYCTYAIARANNPKGNQVWCTLERGGWHDVGSSYDDIDPQAIACESSLW